MAKFTEKTIPQEFLVRWKSDGTIQGCHIVQKEQLYKDGNLYSEKTTEPMPVRLGIENAENQLDLSEVLEGINQQLVLNVEQLQSESNNLKSELSKRTKEVDDVSKELNIRDNSLKTANDEIEQLRSELQETQSELVESKRVNQELINNINVHESNQTKEVDS